jgi:hypothetical protein
VRCPCCGGTGEAPKGLGYYGACPECYGTGAVDTARRWLRAWRHLGDRSVALLFFSAAAGLMFGIPAVLALGFVLWLCGVSTDPSIGTLYAGTAALIALALFTSYWFSDDGPARRGRGMAQKWAKWPTVAAARSPFVVGDAYPGDPQKRIRQVVVYFLTALVFGIVMAFQCAIVVFIIAVIPVVWLLYGADHLMDDFSLMPLRIIASASGVAFFVFVWCADSGPSRPGRGLFRASRSEASQMILDYVEMTGYFILRVSPADRSNVQKLMHDHGLQFSIPGSTPDTACLFTKDRRIAADFVEHATARARAQLAASPAALFP